jgi:hypothetical protein
LILSLLLAFSVFIAAYWGLRPSHLFSPRIAKSILNNPMLPVFNIAKSITVAAIVDRDLDRETKRISDICELIVADLVFGCSEDTPYRNVLELNLDVFDTAGPERWVKAYQKSQKMEVARALEQLHSALWRSEFYAKQQRTTGEPAIAEMLASKQWLTVKEAAAEFLSTVKVISIKPCSG